MNNAKIRETVLKLFEANRQIPGANYDDARFMAFLTKNPHKSKKVVADTFRGRYYYVRFMQAIQLEFGLCFSNQDWDRGFSVDAFTDLIQQKIAKPETALRLAENRLASAKTEAINSPIKFGVISLVFIILGIAIGNLIWRSLLIFLGAVVLGLVVYLSQREIAYTEKLIKRIKTANIVERLDLPSKE